MKTIRFGSSLITLKVLAVSALVGCGGQQFPLAQGGQNFRAAQPTTKVGAKWVLKERSPYVPGEVVVQVNQGFSTQSFNAQSLRAFNASGSRPKQQLRIHNQEFMLMNVPNSQDLGQVVATLRQDPAVQYAAPNPRYMALQYPPRPPQNFSYSTTPRVGLFNQGPAANGGNPAAGGVLNDAFFRLQWSLQKIGIPNAWNIGGQGAPNLTVAVIDSGVDYQHPDLKGQIINGKDFMVDTVSGPNGEGSPDTVGDDPLDQMGHGTHVAGIIGALANNQTGIAGIAPGVKILNIKALNRDGWGSAFAIAQGVTYAVDQGARIINMSLGSAEGSKPIELAIQYALSKGVLVVAAAGNSFTKTGFPANYPGVLAVGATDQADWLADFSNHDSRINVMAPGVDIMSTTPSYMTNTMLKNGIDPLYSVMSGTSMAAPMVSAQAALLLSRNPNLTATELQDIIQKTAIKVGDQRIFGHGRIQIDASLDYLASQQPPTTAPPAPDNGQVNAQRFMARR